MPNPLKVNQEKHRQIPSLFLSLLIHAILLLGFVTLARTQRNTGKVQILEIELGWHAGAGLHSEMKKAHKERKKRNELSDTNSTARQKDKEQQDADSPQKESRIASEASGTSTSGNDQGGGNPSEIGNYIAEITHLINQTKKYPRLALLREEEGQVLVSMDVASDGTLSNQKIEKPSSYEALNSGALETILALRKLPPMPPMMKEGIHLHIPILYQMNR